MKNTILTLIAALAFTGITANASNKIEKPIWDCSLTFHAKGGGIQLILGSFNLSGPGKIRCIDIAGNQQDMDVKVSLGARPVALNIAIGKMQLAGIATGIGVASGPEALLGTYYTASANAAVLLGVGANMSLHGGAEAVTLNLGVNLVQGAGFQMGLNRLTIESLN